MQKVLKSVCCFMVVCGLFFGSAASASETLNFGIIPLVNQDIMKQQFLPLAKYLSQEIGMEVKLHVGQNYQDTMDAIGTNKVQIAYLTPTTFPKSAVQNPTAGVKPLVRFLKNGTGTYRSCVIAPIDSDIETLADLKGKKFAFGNKNSTSSHLMPRSILAGAGIQFEDIQAEYLGSHSKVAKAVGGEQFSGGGVKESVAQKFAGYGQVKIIATSNPIPQFPICLNNSVSPELEAKLLSAFEKLNDGSDASKTILTTISKKFTGTEKTVSADYDVIRTMIDNLYGNSFYER
ncbi:MAG: phosphate/phosphite/phosphonate ABC transporter substrate-binding protein [Desulfuromusa sp.]